MRPAGSIALAGAFALVQTPVLAEGGAEALGVMSVSLSDVVKPRLGIQGQTQGAGTPNQAGVGGYLPLVIGENSVLFLDALANVNFGDFSGYSSIINTEVSGITISTSSRLGYRWLTDDRSWMFGINGGYDTRPMATGNADTGVAVTNKNSVFFQQAAFGLEAVSNQWNLNAYGLIPIGTTEYTLNSVYKGGALDTYGFDAGYNITPQWTLSAGYYYQNGDLGAADGSGVQGRLAYSINDNITIGGNYSYDDAFDSRVSADLSVRFGGPSTTAAKKKKWENPTINSLTASIKNRDVRVHDYSGATCIAKLKQSIPTTMPHLYAKYFQACTCPGYQPTNGNCYTTMQSQLHCTSERFACRGKLIGKSPNWTKKQAQKKKAAEAIAKQGCLVNGFNICNGLNIGLR